ncbi:hypothetical protein EON65_38125 [archaeon]|nr:MAG: hypothetical protein EON65_38125 [archaeon]
MIGEAVSSDLELASSNNEIFSISQLLHGAEALVMIFTPYCFGDATNKESIESLILEVDERIDEFNSQDLRVVCITR